MQNLNKLIRASKIQQLQIDETLSEINQEIYNIVNSEIKSNWKSTKVEYSPLIGLTFFTVYYSESNFKDYTNEYSVELLISAALKNKGIIDHAVLINSEITDL